MQECDCSLKRLNAGVCTCPKSTDILNALERWEKEKKEKEKEEEEEKDNDISPFGKMSEW